VFVARVGKTTVSMTQQKTPHVPKDMFAWSWREIFRVSIAAAARWNLFGGIR
jgi:hypothetical protein